MGPEQEGQRVSWIRWFRDLTHADVPLVGGKNASLGEMIRELGQLGVRVPDGFAVTAEGYREFLRHNQIEAPISELLSDLDKSDVQQLAQRSQQIQRLIQYRNEDILFARDMVVKAGFLQMDRISNILH